MNLRETEASVEDTYEAFHSGCYGYLTKTFSHGYRDLDNIDYISCLIGRWVIFFVYFFSHKVLVILLLLGISSPFTNLLFLSVCISYNCKVIFKTISWQFWLCGGAFYSKALTQNQTPISFPYWFLLCKLSSNVHSVRIRRIRSLLEKWKETFREANN